LNRLAGVALTGWAAATVASIVIAFGGDAGTVHDIATNVAGGAIAAPVVAAGAWGVKNLRREGRLEP
jgi:hypothetical protein